MIFLIMEDYSESHFSFPIFLPVPLFLSSPSPTQFLKHNLFPYIRSLLTLLSQLTLCGAPSHSWLFFPTPWFTSLFLFCSHSPASSTLLSLHACLILFPSLLIHAPFPSSHYLSLKESSIHSNRETKTYSKSMIKPFCMTIILGLIAVN